MAAGTTAKAPTVTLAINMTAFYFRRRRQELEQTTQLAKRPRMYSEYATRRRAAPFTPPTIRESGNMRGLRQTQSVSAIAVLTCAAALCQPKPELKYAIEFTSVTDSNGEFNTFGTFPAINNHGEVAFTAIKSGAPGVFRSREGLEQLVTIASTKDALNSFGADVSISPSGMVAFGASTASNSRAIIKGDGKSLTSIVDSTAAGFIGRVLGSPSINASGTVAFSAVFAQRGQPAGVFTGDGGPLRAVAATSPFGFHSFQNAAINASGKVAFEANLVDGSKGLFVVSAASLEKIVDSNTHPEIDTLNDPVINNSGTVADVAFLLPSEAPEAFTARNGRFTPRNDPATAPFLNTDHPSLNNSGAIAFAAITLTSASDPTGIFLEVSGGESLIPLIRPGDQLFGSSVTHVGLGRFALNDRLQIAFSYTLADGRSGIAIASYNGER